MKQVGCGKGWVNTGHCPVSTAPTRLVWTTYLGSLLDKPKHLKGGIKISLYNGSYVTSFTFKWKVSRRKREELFCHYTGEVVHFQKTSRNLYKLSPQGIMLRSIPLFLYLHQEIICWTDWGISRNVEINWDFVLLSFSTFWTWSARPNQLRDFWCVWRVLCCCLQCTYLPKKAQLWFSIWFSLRFCFF